MSAVAEMTRISKEEGRAGSLRRRYWTRSMLLRGEELPSSGWRLAYDRTWRVGESPGKPLDTPEEFKSRLEFKSPEFVRAQQTGGYEAYRMFFKKSPLVEIALEVIAYASTEDAVSAVPAQLAKMREKKRDSQTLKMENEVVKELPGIERAHFLERECIHLDEPCHVLVVAGNVEEIAFYVMCSHHGEGWTWDAVLELSTLQTKKNRSSVDRSRK